MRLCQWAVLGICWDGFLQGNSLDYSGKWDQNTTQMKTEYVDAWRAMTEADNFNWACAVKQDERMNAVWHIPFLFYQQDNNMNQKYYTTKRFLLHMQQSDFSLHI